jgi:hypothetical protein
MIKNHEWQIAPFYSTSKKEIVMALSKNIKIILNDLLMYAGIAVLVFFTIVCYVFDSSWNYACFRLALFRLDNTTSRNSLLKLAKLQKIKHKYLDRMSYSFKPFANIGCEHAENVFFFDSKISNAIENCHKLCIAGWRINFML